MKKIIISAIILISNTSFCFSQNESNQADEITPKYYEGCCGIKPVEYNLGNAMLYIPNVFTPNGDGLNDLFFPHSSDNIINIESFTILSAEGDSVLFYRRGISYENIEQFAWDGKRYNGESFETEYKGRFKYAMAIVNDKKVKTIIKGEACVIRCGADSKIFKDNDGCFYSEHAEGKKENGNKKEKNKGNGQVDKTKKTKEKECI